MATSYIDYKDNGFWIKDSLLELLLYYIIFYTKDDTDIKKERWRSDFIHNLEMNASGIYSSFMDLNLTEYLLSETRRKWFIQLLNYVADEIEINKSDTISIKELNLIELGKSEDLVSLWKRPLKTSNLLRLIEYLKNIVLNKSIEDEFIIE